MMPSELERSKFFRVDHQVREGTSRVRLLKAAGAVRALFDDPNLVSYAGLEPVMRLAESCDLHGIVGERLRVPTDKGANASGKVATIVAGMVAGADSIDDLDAVRHGGMAELFGGVYAPSTLGSFLRALTHGHVRQLQGAGREFLVELARRTPLLPGAGAVTFIDVDSLLRRVYGKRKQGVGFGHAKVGGYQVLLRGLNALVATISTPDAAPVIAATRLRAGNTSSGRGAASLVAEAIATTQGVLAARPGSAEGLIVVRADSAFYSRKVIAVCRRAGACFSVTVRIDKKVKRSIEAIPADAWVEIAYPQPVWDDEQQRFISRAQIAEIRYTAFEGTADEVTARLIVRRIPDLNKTTVDAQGELFPVWRYHAAFTDSPFVLVQAEDHHATPSSNRSSPNSSTAHWPICPPAGSTPTTPGSP
jgi:Transposase DDE domain group 1